MHDLTRLLFAVSVLFAALPVSADIDGDGIADNDDNCIFVFNPTQTDDNGDGLGNACSDAPVAVLHALLTDDGDDDGYADTRETVQMRLAVRNGGQTPITGLDAWLATGSPHVCVAGNAIEIGDLAPGEERVTDEAFLFHVLDVERTTVAEDLTVRFDVVMASDQTEPFRGHGDLTLDLDLNVSGGAVPTTFHEGFESATLGAFEIQNLDAAIPGNSHAEGLINGDGYRCQYSDPDWVNSGSYDSDQAPTCYPGFDAAHADAVFWQVDGATISDSPDGGRSFTGSHALYYGQFIPSPAGTFSTPASVLEAVATSDPINLGPQRPVLSFKHQISLIDDRWLGAVPPLRSSDRGVVQIQLADDAGGPSGDWLRLEPYVNVYDQAAVDNYFNCMFDPVDDGSEETDFFDPTDPERRLGPSSTCFPFRAYSYLGDTDESFSPTNVGNAIPGSGLDGELGTGTWVESTFDLSRWRGRRVRLRFLATALRHTQTSWVLFALNPDPREDGWWIDDVTVDEVLTIPATVAVDTADNSGLPGVPSADSDGDGFLDACDTCPSIPTAVDRDVDVDGLGDVCDPCPVDPTNPPDPDGDMVCGAADNCPLDANADQTDADLDGFGAACDCSDEHAATFPGAVEINDGLDNQCPGDPGHGVADELMGTSGFLHPAGLDYVYSWPAQTGAATYQAARATSPDFVAGCTLFPVTSLLRIIDFEEPDEGAVFFYMARPRSPNTGSWGQSSNGSARTVACEP